MFERLFASKKKPCFKQSSHWDKLSFDLSGCRFDITLPPHDYDFPEKPSGKHINLFDPTIYQYDMEPRREGCTASKRGITRNGILHREWFSYGPIWRAQNIGILSCHVSVCDVSKMGENINCFNKNQFEKLAIHALYYSEGPGMAQREYTCPVNWQVREIAGIQWLYMESWDKKPEWLPSEDPKNDYRPVHFSVWMFTPLFNDKYLLVTFSGNGSLPPKPSNELMFKRIEKILPSLRLSLSPESFNQRREAERQTPGAKYSKTRQSENWKYYDSWEYNHGGVTTVDFKGLGSPPPDLT